MSDRSISKLFVQIFLGFALSYALLFGWMAL